MDDERNQITSTPLINFNEELEKLFVPAYSAAHSATLDFVFVFLYKHTFLQQNYFSLLLYWKRKKKDWIINESFFESIDTLTEWSFEFSEQSF